MVLLYNVYYILEYILIYVINKELFFYIKFDILIENYSRYWVVSLYWIIIYFIVCE